MIRVGFFKVRPDHEERLRAWMHELTQRRDEVLETFRAESTQHECTYPRRERSHPRLCPASR